MRRYFLITWITCLGPAADAADVKPANQATLPVQTIKLLDPVRQGSLIVGLAPPGSEVQLAGQTLRLNHDGYFVFGLERQAHSPCRLDFRVGNGPRQSIQVAIESVTWTTEQIQGVPSQSVTPSQALARRIAREQAQVGQVRLRDDDRSDFLQPLIWPVHGRISGQFGAVRVYNGIAQSPHSGVDIAAAAGTAVVAPASGVVSLAKTHFALTGGTVVLDHGHGVSSNFLHLSQVMVHVGEHLCQGQVLGRVGATGRATGPHLHWGMNWFATRIDPVNALANGLQRSLPIPSAPASCPGSAQVAPSPTR